MHNLNTTMDPKIYRQMAINIERMYHGGPYESNLGEYMKNALSDGGTEFLTPAAKQLYETYIEGQSGARMNRIIGRLIRCFKSFVYAESAFGYIESIAAQYASNSFNENTKEPLEFKDPSIVPMLSLWINDTLGVNLTAIVHGPNLMDGDLLARLVYQNIASRKCSFYNGVALQNYLNGIGNDWGLHRSDWDPPKYSTNSPFVAAVGGSPQGHKAASQTRRKIPQETKSDTANGMAQGQDAPQHGSDTSEKAWVRPGLKKMRTYKTSIDVQDIQHILNVSDSANLQEDGAFGPMTIDAVYKKLTKDKPSIDKAINDAFNNNIGGGILKMTDAK